jgi:lipid-A-disaccharide synthase-like uncharacterized protein
MSDLSLIQRALSVAAAANDNPLPGFMPFQNNYWLWKGIGYLGMALFFSRFFVQWLYSEKHKESKVPVIFWWQSLAGAFLMLMYSLRQQDSVYILGYLFTVIPYSRNLMLVYRKRREQAAAAAVLQGVSAAPR